MTETNSINARVETLLKSGSWRFFALVWLVAYFAGVWQLADHFPKFDDLNDTFGFFRELNTAHTFSEKFVAFFFPNNEHITATNHILYWLQLKFFDTLDFKWLVMAGHVVVALTAWATARLIHSPRQAWWTLLLTLAYVNLHSWESTFMAMTALSNQSVLLFAVLTFGCLQRGAFLPGLLCAALATFSQGNGMLLWPLGFIMLWQNRTLATPTGTTIPVFHLLVWLSTAIACIALYSWAKLHYPIPESQFTPEWLLARWLQAPWLPITASLVFLGSTALPEGQSLIAGTLALLCGIQLARLYRHDSQTHRALFFLAIFLVLSACTASGLRALVGGAAEYMMTSRYRMYSILFVMITLILSAERATTLYQHGLALLALCLSIVIHATGYQHIAAIQSRSQDFQQSYNHWLVDGDFRRAAVHFPRMSDYYLFIAHYIGDIDLLRLASPDTVVIQPIEQTGRACPAVNTPAQNCSITLKHRGNAIAVHLSAAFFITDENPHTKLQLQLCTPDGQAVKTLALPDVSGTLDALLPEAVIPPGQYTAWLLNDQDMHCSSPFIKKPRKVDEQMHNIFNG